MIHPIPSGTRDVLPDEMRELRAITEAMRAVFEARGYGEVATPALEYETVLTAGDPAAADPAYKLFDEHGNVLVLRSDMTIPIARVVRASAGKLELDPRFVPPLVDIAGSDYLQAIARRLLEVLSAKSSTLSAFIEFSVFLDKSGKLVLARTSTPGRFDSTRIR